MWLVVGTLAAAVVAVIPSPEGAEGYEMLLTAMHNVGAVVGYGVFVFMELAQVHRPPSNRRPRPPPPFLSRWPHTA